MKFSEMTARLGPLDTACLCDADKVLQVQLRVMDAGIRPIGRGRKMIGLAHTLRCHNDFLTVIKALGEAVAGEVLVIDSQSSNKAVTGELFPTEAMRKGLTGIVNDGPCRDTASVGNMQIAYYARSVCCVAGTSNQVGETQVPVQCGGVQVEPGEILFGDDDGVIVATASQLQTLIPVAEEIKRKETRLLAGMAAGKSLHDMLNFEEHWARRQAGQQSRLEFRA